MTSWWHDGHGDVTFSFYTDDVDDSVNCELTVSVMMVMMIHTDFNVNTGIHVDNWSRVTDHVDVNWFLMVNDDVTETE